MSELTLSEDDELRAAELALELIDADERVEAETRLARDPAFRAAHGRWLNYAAAMIGGRAEPPRPSVWTRIEARLPAHDADRSGASAVRWWQASTAAASIAALLLAAVALDPAPPPTPRTIVVQRAAPPPLVAIMTGDGSGAVAVSYDAASGQLTLAPAKLSVGGKAAELWVIPAGEKPRSLGVILASGTGRRAAPAGLARYLVPGATLAISVEPLGGSPTGQPTGPVIVSGAVSTT